VLYQIYSSFEEKEIFCVLFVGMAWVKVVGAVGTFFVGSVVPLAWNYSEPSRMACQVCLLLLHLRNDFVNSLLSMFFKSLEALQTSSLVWLV
jgi:hypothetical protein